MTNYTGLSSLRGINGMWMNVTLWICFVNHADLSAAQENSVFDKSGSELKLVITVPSRPHSRRSQAWDRERKTVRFISVPQRITDPAALFVCVLRAWGQCIRTSGVSVSAGTVFPDPVRVVCFTPCSPQWSILYCYTPLRAVEVNVSDLFWSTSHQYPCT